MRLPAVSGETRRRAVAVLFVLLLAFTVRALTANFMRAHLSDPGWFQTGTFAIFDNQARDVLDGRASWFWIDDPSRTQAAVYPPGYSSWLALLYGVTGSRSVYVVQNVQWALDALSVLLVVGIGASVFNWRVGLLSGALAALSPLLALYGATPMADAPTSWVVLGGVWMFWLAAERKSWKWAAGAGLMVGASCWLRANALLLVFVWALCFVVLVRGAWALRLRLAGAVIGAAVLVVTPVIVRNAVAFHAFLPTGMGVGTNLWEGIGETERAAEFGAVYGDANLVEQERAQMGLAPDAPLGLYWPDGVRRDRERAGKALKVIFSNPLWYAGVMARRMWGVLNYAGEPSTYYGYAGVNVTSAKALAPEWRGGLVALFVNALGALQSVWRHIALPLMAAGVWLAWRRSWRTAALLLATVLYYLVVGSFMHNEIRYGLPMQALLLVFAAYGAARIVEGAREIWHRRRAQNQGGAAGER